MTQTTETKQIDIFKNLIADPPGSQENPMDIPYYMGLVWRRRWFVMAIFCMAMISGIYLAIALPKTYQAETLVFIEPPRVPEVYVQSVVSTDLDARLSHITQMIKSRTNIMNIIERFRLFSEPEHDNMYIEDKIEKMRDRTQVNLITDSRKRTANAFTISFQGKDPSKVMNVVNTMATMVIDQNLKTRESQAIGTSEFLNDQLVKMRENLEAVEKDLGDYQKIHMGELPEQLDSNLMILERLQQQLNEKQISLRTEKNRLLSLVNQIQLAREQLNIAGTSQEPSLELLKEHLANYKSRYTDQYPDVIQLQKRIAEMEKANGPVATTMEAELIQQRKGIEREIAVIKREISDLNRQIVFYQRRVEDTPKREQELLSLKRNYENIQETYNSLLQRKLEADIAANMEKRQKGEQFRILDPARLPDKPISPDMKKLFLMCVAAGLACCGGLIFLLNFLDNSVKKPETIPDKLGIPILAVMPTIKHRKDIIWRRINIMFSIFGALVSMALLACFAAVSILDVHQVVDFIKKYAIDVSGIL
ncbi:MAG: GNVR domain-containing protein [Thermodesulfobacteriota bacterium]|nr:GNVR domain-containing protein [Thermodesulfobacteriota bacterium]